MRIVTEFQPLTLSRYTVAPTTWKRLLEYSFLLGPAYHPFTLTIFLLCPRIIILLPALFKLLCLLDSDVLADLGKSR